jgi:flagellar motor switch protein FliN
MSSLAILLSQLTAESWQSDGSGEPAEYDAVASFRITSPQLGGAGIVSLSQSDLAALLSIFLGEQGNLSAELDEMQREAAGELLRQWCGLAASALKKDYGEVSLQAALEAEIRPAASSECARLVRISNGSTAIWAVVELDEGMISWLRDLELKAPSTLTTPTPPSKESSRVEELLREGNLELLMDVELPVMLSFGSREVTLREVLDMATGAVLELNREIQEPVDLVLNGKVIARGDVVVIDGNYGLRVTEVASPQQRANSL